MVLKGWITASITDKEFLESLGIQLGDYDHAEHEFTNCVVTEEVLRKLNPLWGTFFWGLFPVMLSFSDIREETCAGCGKSVDAYQPTGADYWIPDPDHICVA